MIDANFEHEKKSKPWHTKEWKEMRKRRIGDRCEQCSSTDGPLVIQHFSHDRPSAPSKNAIVWDLMREYGRVPPRPIVPHPTCPKCSARSLGQRKKLRPKWRCNRCKNEFDDPTMVETIINNRTQKDAWVKWKNEVLFPARDDFLVSDQDLVEQRYRAVMDEYDVERQASYDHYVSGEGTATFCKKCAFLWDMKGMMLCGQCRQNYHPFRYDTCLPCLPESRKEEIKEGQRFVQEMQEFVDSIDDLYEESSDESN